MTAPPRIALIGFAVLFLGCAMAFGAERATISFESYPLDKLPSDWREGRTGEGDGSVWRVKDDRGAPAGSRVLAQTSSAGPDDSFNVCVFDGSKHRDLEVQVAFKPLGGKLDQGGGLVWRFRDFKNYYIARFNPLENNFRVYKVVDGKRTQLGTADVAASAGQWHKLHIQQRGEHIECYLNDKRYLEVDDKTFDEAGLVGLWTKSDAVTYFDALSIEDLDK